MGMSEDIIIIFIIGFISGIFLCFVCYSVMQSIKNWFLERLAFREKKLNDEICSFCGWLESIHEMDNYKLCYSCMREAEELNILDLNNMANVKALRKKIRLTKWIGIMMNGFNWFIMSLIILVFTIFIIFWLK
jgi:hypothetical protein